MPGWMWWGAGGVAALLFLIRYALRRCPHCGKQMKKVKFFAAQWGTMTLLKCRCGFIRRAAF